MGFSFGPLIGILSEKKTVLMIYQPNNISSCFMRAFTCMLLSLCCRLQSIFSLDIEIASEKRTESEEWMRRVLGDLMLHLLCMQICHYQLRGEDFR